MTQSARKFPRVDRALALIGAASFLIAGMSTAPASLLAAVATRAAPLLSIGGAEGTVWRGAFTDVAHDGIHLGRVDFRLSLLSLFAARIGADLTVSGGALDAKARVTASRDRIGIENARARFNLAAIRRYTIFGLRYQGTADVTAKRISLSRRFCAADDARIATTALDGIARRWTGEGMPLAGVASCEEGVLVISLAGENREGGVTLTTRVSPDFAYKMAVTAAPRRDEMRAALRAFGFLEDNAALSYLASGRLKGLTS